jgi:transcriptional regulator with XRE-family HTH domain
MSTCIRAIRKQRNLTLQQLASMVDTTPQTIQRLETGNMSVSVAWLERISRALGLTAADLLRDAPRGQRVAVLGHLDGAARVHIPLTVTNTGPGFSDADVIVGTHPSHITMPVITEDCFAVTIQQATGPFAAGSILVATKQAPDDPIVDGCDCLLALDTGDIVLKRVQRLADGKLTAHDYDQPTAVVPVSNILWIAPVFIIVKQY